jgi:tetratricopeptide (TPR) repeat protein
MNHVVSSLVVAVALSIGVAGGPHVLASPRTVAAVVAVPTGPAAPSVVLADAQRLFYTGRYEEAAALALELRSTDSEALSAYELRSSALLFQIRRALGDPGDKEKALKACAACATLMSAFRTDIDSGRDLARERLKVNAQDDDARFFLGKLNLNYVWLQLGTLGRRTGWDEYWEARHSLDAVLKQNPAHVRGRVARAWIDYIVDTRMPFGTAWILGGGNKKRALKTVREAAQVVGADSFDQTEATFALWDMHVREKNFKDAVLVARGIARDFPENHEVERFLETHDAAFKSADPTPTH